MRRSLGWLLVVLGSLIAVVGMATAVAFGPDNALASGPHAFRSSGAAIITAPAALAYQGPTLEVTADSPGRKVFVGVAQDVDVRDYLHATAYTRIDTIDLPWSTTTTAVQGDQQPAAAPGDLDIWLVKDSGDGSASLRFPLPDEPVDVVVMDAALAPAFGTDLTMAIVQPGAFWTGVALLVLGVGVAAAGWLMKRTIPARGRRSPARHAGERNKETRPSSPQPTGRHL